MFLASKTQHPQMLWEVKESDPQVRKRQAPGSKSKFLDQRFPNFTTHGHRLGIVKMLFLNRQVWSRVGGTAVLISSQVGDAPVAGPRTTLWVAGAYKSSAPLPRSTGLSSFSSPAPTTTLPSSSRASPPEEATATRMRESSRPAGSSEYCSFSVTEPRMSCTDAERRLRMVT